MARLHNRHLFCGIPYMKNTHEHLNKIEVLKRDLEKKQQQYKDAMDKQGSWHELKTLHAEIKKLKKQIEEIAPD